MKSNTGNGKHKMDKNRRTQRTQESEVNQMLTCGLESSCLIYWLIYLRADSATIT